MKADELLDRAIEWLRGQYPEARIVPEFSVGNWGAAKLDVAAIIPADAERLFRGDGEPRTATGHIVGVEIKGEGDSPSRLALQGAIYSKAAQKMYILPSPSNAAQIFKHIPRSWGRLGVIDGAVHRVNKVGLRDDRPREPEWLCTAPAQLLQALWKDELLHVARCLNMQPTRRMTVDELICDISEIASLREVRQAVVCCLMERNWLAKRVIEPLKDAA